ncbi:MAG: ATP-binding cassette domain-containing protein [Pseudomonadota bacterium]|nr:ATP-binding cassette domain-containing protein [Pseudomonadota bacterium]
MRKTLKFSTLKKLSTQHRITQIIGASQQLTQDIQHQALSQPDTCFIPHLAYTTLNPTRCILKQLRDIAPEASQSCLIAHFRLFEIPQRIYLSRPQSLSVGWQQLVAISIALFHRYNLVIAEHILASLSSHNQTIVLQFLQHYADQTPLVFLVPRPYTSISNAYTVNLSPPPTLPTPSTTNPSSNVTTQVILSLDSVTLKPYGVELLKHVSFDLHAQECIGIIGPNGCGKSSLCLAILQRLPYSGDILLDKQLIIKGSQIYNQQAIQLVPQHAHLLFDPLLPIQRSFSIARIPECQSKQALNYFHLPETVFMSYPGSLSHLQLKSLAIIRAVLRRPRVLILDEPFSSNDLPWSRLLKTFLETYQQSVIIIDHDQSLLQQMTHRTFNVRDGLLYAM